MKANKVVITALGIFFTNLVLAGNDSAWRPVATLSSGPAWSAPGKTQTIYLQPELPETFAANSMTEVFGAGDVFLGLQHHLVHHLQAQFGVTVAGTTAIPLKGDIWQGADPDFNNLSYDYKINHAHVAVKAKFLTDISSWIQPYVSGSLGVAFNHAYQYSSTPKLFEVLPEPPFKQQTVTAFTYTLGVGLQRSLNDHWSISVGYEFADWGKTSLAAATGQLSNNGLNLNHVYTHGLQFSISVVI